MAYLLSMIVVAGLGVVGLSRLARRVGPDLVESARPALEGMGVGVLIGSTGLWAALFLFSLSVGKAQGTVLFSQPISMTSPSWSPRYGQSWAHTYRADIPHIYYEAQASTYTFTSWPTWRGHYRHDDTVAIYYSKRNPSRSWSRDDLLLWPVFFSSGGLLLMAVAAFG